MILSDTPTTQHYFDSISFYLKRDDLLHPYFSGNKARKLMALLEMDAKRIRKIVSYGSPQANSLLSLAALCKLKGWQCDFYVSRIPSWLKTRPLGNYRSALSLGANIISMESLGLSDTHPRDYIKARGQSDTVFYVPEGGSFPLAEKGVAKLANEILDWSESLNIGALSVALPSGTGTTALYLHKALKKTGIEVLTCACVGDAAYLEQEFQDLGETDFPHILTLEKKHHFGRLNVKDYQIWLDLKKQTQVEFDLLYDPFMWQCLMHHKERLSNRTLLYIHQGGLIGNESMLPRYQKTFPHLS